MQDDDSGFTRDRTTLGDEPEAAVAATLEGERYVLGDVIGLGGMGEVRTCFDAHLSREVAMKVIRSDRDPAQLESRFLAEARVQGALEHPGIVPVHDVGRDASGRAFFTMKRVHGIDLDVVLGRLRRGDPATRREYTLHRLLTIFAQVCLTVDFAHGHGVAHRDLKPSNIMLGDHGEVYVLDWGIAKVRPAPIPGAVDDETGPPSHGMGESRAAPTFVGTLGYVAPELVSGKRGNARSDVFSLGAILFEALTGEPLARNDAQAIDFMHHRRILERHPRLRVPALDVPAELDAICHRATSPDPKERFATARELHDAVEAFLSGDRDLALRHRLAAQHLARASAVLSRKPGGVPIDADEAEEALRDAGRAIALAPEDPRTVEVLVRLLTLPRRELPAEVTAQVTRLSAERIQRAVPSWALFVLPLGWLTIFPVVLLVGGVRDWFEALLVPVVWSLAGAVVYMDLKMTRRRVAERDRNLGTWVSLVALMAAVASTTVLTGPLIVTPTLTVAMAMGATVRPTRRKLPAMLGLLVLLGTSALALAGVHDPYHFDHGVIVPRFAQPLTSITSLYVGSTALNVMTLIVATLFANRYRQALDAAEASTVLTSWRLAKLLPRDLPTRL